MELPPVSQLELAIALHLIGEQLLASPSADLLRAHQAFAQWSGFLLALEGDDDLVQQQPGDALHRGDAAAAVAVGV